MWLMKTNNKESDDTRIALINNNIEFIKTYIAQIKTGIKELSGVYATRGDLIQIAKDTETRLLRLENASNFWKFLSPTFAAITGSILTFLIIQYLGT